MVRVAVRAVIVVFAVAVTVTVAVLEPNAGLTVSHVGCELATIQFTFETISNVAVLAIPDISIVGADIVNEGGAA